MEKLTLENLGNGAALEKFQDELERVIENCADINTDHKKVREVTLKVKIVPNQDRDSFNATIECTAKLAPAAPHSVPGFIGKENGKLVAFHFDPPVNEKLDLKPVSVIKSA